MIISTRKWTDSTRDDCSDLGITLLEAIRDLLKIDVLGDRLLTTRALQPANGYIQAAASIQIYIYTLCLKKNKTLNSCP